MQATGNGNKRCFDRRDIKDPLALFAADLCREANVRFRGIQSGFGKTPAQILADNAYGSTFCIPLPGATLEKLVAEYERSNMQWEAVAKVSIEGESEIERLRR